MATINISDLRPTGSDLFSDSESYLKDLSEEELAIQGGFTPLTPVIVPAAISSEACALSVVAVVTVITEPD